MARHLTKHPRQIEWTAQQLEDFKSLARDQIQRWRETLEPSETMLNILKEVAAYKEGQQADAQLWCFIFCMSALVHHEQVGGLNHRQVEDLFELAESILKVRGIQPKKSRLTSMYSDLHIIRSQLFRKQGDHWSAAWEQHLALRYSGGKPSGGKSFHDFAMGNRLIRMGCRRLAISYYAAALEKGAEPKLTSQQASRLELSRITGFRISGELDLAEALITSMLKVTPKDSRIGIDLHWERLCCEAQRSQDIRALMATTRRGLPHHTAGYVVEMVLWGLCMPKREGLKDLIILETLRRNKTLKVKVLGLFFEAVSSIQFCYDQTVPIEIRMRRLSQNLRRTHELISMDKELMIWLAAARCLVRLRSYEMAVLCMARYESLSLQSSDGECHDGLGVATDLFTADWFRHPERSASEEELFEEESKKSSGF